MPRPRVRVISRRTPAARAARFQRMEASLLAGIPHAGLCGGRARCSLCRVRVRGAPALPPPDEPERRVLARLQADATHVRLACQLRPPHDISILPPVPRMRRQRSCIAVSNAPCRVSISLRSCSWTCAVRRNSLGTAAIRQRVHPRSFRRGVSSAVVEAGGLPPIPWRRRAGDLRLAIGCAHRVPRGGAGSRAGGPQHLSAQCRAGA